MTPTHTHGSDKMKTYRITNTRRGHDFGLFAAETPEDALDAVAQEAGYPDYAALQSVAPAAEGDIEVQEISVPDLQTLVDDAAAGRETPVEVTISYDGDFVADIEDGRGATLQPAGWIEPGGWAEHAAGYSVADFFDECGEYLGPNEYGVYPVFTADEA